MIHAGFFRLSFTLLLQEAWLPMHCCAEGTTARDE
jgi:hypothetical protein